MDIASSILTTIPTDSQSQIRSNVTSNIKPSNKTTKRVRAKKVSWNYDETLFIFMDLNSFMKLKRSSTNVISLDVAILERLTSCLPCPHPRLLQTDLETHSTHAKSPKQGSLVWAQ